MKNVIILDLDGVLILTPSWKSDIIHPDGYSDFDTNCVQNLNTLMADLDAELWLSSSRRIGKDLDKFRKIFINRNIKSPLIGFIPGETLGKKRKIEIDAFLDNEPINNFLIIDDDSSLNDLTIERNMFFVKTDFHSGFNTDKLLEAQKIISKWS